MTKKINIGGTFVGGGAPVSIQSMTNVKTKDIEKTAEQINELAANGCEIIRVAVPDMESAVAIDKIKDRISIPLVADIHFDYKLALECIKRGADKIRINPGNIGSKERVRKVAEAAGEKGIPIRIGVNGGSLEPHILKKYGRPTPEGMVDSALYHIKLLEDCGFYDIAVSLKASDVKTTVEAYRIMSKKCDYPLHLGVTEAGTVWGGTIRSAMGIGALLLDGIGDTIRVSLTADPVEEIIAAKEILRSAGLRDNGVRVVSCPTCARCQINMIPIAEKVTKAVEKFKKPMKVAVMGCAVNGPGEAKDADIGVAGGNGCGLIFKKGEILRRVPEDRIFAELMLEIEKMQE
ncbi:MAG: flavodoxin-dependent (E)-4-hydroxy-3-methylbut-2-enyl-diphosphate synthase [Clostridia bacterium]|nr:flavodoxin-dependent (E)-4-hydroxy-3-methylbut-2-enyl-diphosphate synthase [Clostridia bacterium]